MCLATIWEEGVSHDLEGPVPPPPQRGTAAGAGASSAVTVAALTPLLGFHASAD